MRQTVARPRPVPIGIVGDGHLRQLPRRPRHLSGGRHAIDALPGQRGHHVRQVPSLHRRAAASQRSRPGQGTGRRWPEGWPPAENRGSIRLAPPATKDMKSPWPPSEQFHRQLPNLCGNCHGDLSGRYAMTIHGELTKLGYQPAANCYDCHDSHRILPASNPASRMSPQQPLDDLPAVPSPRHRQFRRLRSARQLPRSEDSPVVYWVYRVLLTLLLTTFGVFGLHAVFWLVRGAGGSVPRRPAERPGARHDGLRAVRAHAPPGAHRLAAVVPRSGLDRLAAEVQPRRSGPRRWRTPSAALNRRASGTASSPW